jgi:hypothetical protein
MGHHQTRKIPFKQEKNTSKQGKTPPNKKTAFQARKIPSKTRETPLEQGETPFKQQEKYFSSKGVSFNQM